jgi:hypothetical protein
VAVTHDGTRVVSHGRDRTVRFWNIVSGTEGAEPLDKDEIADGLRYGGSRI